MSGNEDADPKKERTHWHFETPGERPSVHASTGEDLITRCSLGNSPAKRIPQMLWPSRSRAVVRSAGGLRMVEGDIIGFIASALVLATFAMTDMRRLRMTAIFSNLAFIAYGA